MVGCTAFGYIALQPLYLKHQSLQSEGKSLSASLKTYKEYTHPLYHLPLAVPHREQEELNQKIPVGDNNPEFMAEIQEKIEQNGASLVQLKRIDQLPKTIAADINQEKQEGDSDSHLVPIWLQCEVKVDKEELPSLLEQLQSGKRIVSVLGWDVRFENKGQAEKVMIYLAVYMYEDERVTQAAKFQ